MLVMVWISVMIVPSVEIGVSSVEMSMILEIMGVEIAVGIRWMYEKVGVSLMEIRVLSVEIRLMLERMDAPSMAIYIDVPSVRIGGPSVRIGGPSVRIGGPSVRIGGPSVRIGGPSVRIGGPSVRIGGPSVRIGGPSVRIGGPSVRIGGPSVRIGGPSVRIGGPSVRIGGPSVRIGGPSVENVLSVMEELFTRVSVDILQSTKCSRFASSYNILWLNRRINHRWRTVNERLSLRIDALRCLVLKYPRQFEQRVLQQRSNKGGIDCYSNSIWTGTGKQHLKPQICHGGVVRMLAVGIDIDE